MSILDTFTPSEFEAPIRDVAERFFEQASPDSGREAFSAARWREMASLGWLGVAVGESHGGSGMGIAAASALAEEIGKGLALEPFVESSVVAASIAESTASRERAAALLAGLCDGTRIAAFVHRTPQGREGGARRATAKPVDGGFSLSGAFTLVAAGDFTSDFIVAADLLREVGTVPALFVVPADAGGLTRREYRSIDGRALSDLVLKAVHAEEGALVAEGQEAEAAKERALLRAGAALAAEAVGAMDRAGELTRAYLRERRQFGQPLAGFQALQHYVAEMHAGTEMARTMAMMLRDCAERGGDAGGLALRALATVSRTARMVGERTIQLHGGMGMTEDMQIGRYFKRLLFLAAAMGGETALAGRLAQAIAADIDEQAGADE